MQQCSRFVHRIISKSAQHKAIYNKISPILFDVSLRDGLQGADPYEWPSVKKRETFSLIYKTYQPQCIELGSLCSYKLLPIMSDSKELYNYATNTIRTNNDNNTKAYVLIPSVHKLLVAINNDMTHLSFITSVSDIFQLRNTNLTISQVKTGFSRMFEQLNNELNAHLYVTKLYISCINQCPISGKLDNDLVIKEILYYSSNYPFDELCLSDTCGTLLYEDFEYIVKTIHFFGVPFSRISLHLHVSNSNLNNLELILRTCFRIGIRKFDVSMIETGGCSVTMEKDKLLSNMTYEQFYDILYKHIDATVENNNT
jgi:predicted nuclease of predicted toxin-antitoxin system